MTATTKINCDQCGKDLTSSPDHPNHRLVLYSEPIPVVGPWHNAIFAIPPTDVMRHFCHLGCLGGWTQQRLLLAETRCRKP